LRVGRPAQGSALSKQRRRRRQALEFILGANVGAVMSSNEPLAKALEVTLHFLQDQGFVVVENTAASVPGVHAALSLKEVRN